MLDLVGNPEDQFSQNEAHIRIYHEFVDRIDNSVLRVTAGHLSDKALTSDAKQ